MRVTTYQKIGKEFGMKQFYKNKVSSDFLIQIDSREYSIIGYRKNMPEYDLKEVMIFYDIPPMDCPDQSWGYWNKEYTKNPKEARKKIQERLLLVKKFIYEQKLKNIAKDFK
jgi:hypothetical protein